MVDDEFQEYETFVKRMEERFPKMFAGKYGGFAVGKGWYPILEVLCTNIQSHIDWQNNTAEHAAKLGKPLPEVSPQVVVQQIKEKFGGLRFYHEGGDDYIRGMVRMAEAWADRSCEECGALGTRRNSGWVRTLCDTHEQERNARMEQQAKQDGLEL